MASNGSPILPDRSSAAADFRTRRSTFRRVVLPLRAVLREFRKLRDGVGQRRSRHRRLQEPLRDEIGEAPVRRGGVGVVLHRQPEVSGRLAAG